MANGVASDSFGANTTVADIRAFIELATKTCVLASMKRLLSKFVPASSGSDAIRIVVEMHRLRSALSTFFHLFDFDLQHTPILHAIAL